MGFYSWGLRLCHLLCVGRLANPLVTSPHARFADGELPTKDARREEDLAFQRGSMDSFSPAAYMF